MKPLDIFIGYDAGEACAYHVCANSIIRHATRPIRITPLALNALAPVYRESHDDGSTTFAYSRWLVPYLSEFTGYSLFIDGDMIVKADVAELFDIAKTDQEKAVWCVQHPEYMPASKKKFRGAPQRAYQRKNWSSVMVFRNAASFCRQLTPEYVDRHDGAHLHQFQWLPETVIGELPATWNWLVGEYGHRADAKLIHYTQGIPAFREYQGSDYAEDWFDEFGLATEVIE